MSNTLCIDDDVVLFAAFTIRDDAVDQRLLIAVVTLRKQNVLCAVSDTAPQCDITCITSHNLNNTASLVRSGSITYLIDRLHRGVDCCVKTDSILGTCNIQVNGSRNTDGINTKRSQLACTSERTVSADDYHAVNTVLAADLSSQRLSFRSRKLRTSCGVKNRTTVIDDVGYASLIHINDFFL